METKSETIRARIMPGLKKDAETIFNALGLSTTEAITLFYKQVVINEGLPFEVRIPSKRLKRAMREVKEGKVTHAKSLDDLKRQLGFMPDA